MFPFIGRFPLGVIRSLFEAVFVCFQAVKHIHCLQGFVLALVLLLVSLSCVVVDSCCSLVLVAFVFVI